MTDLRKALDRYKHAVAKRTFWEDHGTSRDGHLEEALDVEYDARKEVFTAARAPQKLTVENETVLRQKFGHVICDSFHDHPPYQGEQAFCDTGELAWEEFRGALRDTLGI